MERNDVVGQPDSASLMFRRLRGLGVLAAALACTTAVMAVAEAQSSNMTVTLPNGYANVVQDDLVVQSTGGPVRWTRVWDGQEWKFNPHWESLSQSWKNLTGSQTADTTAGAVAGGGAVGTVSTSSSSSNTTDKGGCWVWVDEDWEPSVGAVIIGGVPQAGPMAPERTTPFNRIMGEDEFNYSPPMRVSVDYASLCVGTQIATGMQDLEGIRRQNELYLGEQGRYSFSNRAVLEKRAVQMIPEVGAAGLAQMSTGTFTPAPATNAQGYRWIHKEGDWIDYNTQGQAVAYGDRNDNIVWLVRDQSGFLRGVVDAVGHVLFTLHYTSALLTEVRDYPMPGNTFDLPARSVRYQYDDSNRLTVVTDARGNTIRYGYNGQNRIVSVTDQEGRIERFDYNGDTVSKRTAPDGAVTDYVFEYDDANKQFTSKITGPETESGRRVEDHTHNRSGKPIRRIVNGRIEEEVRYDTGARAELHTNARGFVTRITHNEFDQVVRVDHPDGTSEQRSFSAVHLQPTEEIDEAGVKTQYQYDAKGNPIKRVLATGTPAARTTDAIVNSLGQPTSFILRGRTEADGTVTPDSTWLAEYDSKGRYRETIDPEGNVRRYVYNRIGNLVSYTDPRNNETRYEVDAAGNLTSILDAMGRNETYSYDKTGNLTGITDQRGKSTQLAYDAMNRRTQMISPASGVYRVQYNGQGLPVLETDEDGRTSRAEFDPLRRLTKEVDALGNVIEYSYDIPDGTAAGTVGALQEPTEIRYPTFTERRRFDQRERLTSKTLLNPTALGTEGLVDGVVRDKLGLIASVTDANGKTRSYAYDALGQMIETTDSLGAKTRALYDVRGNLLRITDVNGNASRFKYNRNNRLLQEILPLGQTTTYSYDGSGNLLTKTDATGNVARYIHDAADRLQEIQHHRGATLVRTTQFVWDNENNLISWTDIDHTRPNGQQTASGTAAYDDAGNKTAETLNYPTPSGAPYTLAYSYAYSAAGYKTRLTWPDGTTIDYGYAGQGALESVTIPGEGTISVNQFKWLAPEKITLPGGTTQVRTFDGLLNIESLKVRTPSQQSILEFASTYGKVQELKSSSRADTAGGVSTTGARDFTYDAETRLTQVASGGSFGTSTESFTLDAIGNRVAHSKVAGAWTYDANNRLLQKGTGPGSTTFEYDDAGNLTRRTEAGGRVTQYTYDGQNRLTEVRDGSSNLVARYGYDLLDARIWKEQYRDALGNALTQPRRTYYLYSDEGLLAESEQAIILGADGAVTVNAAVNGGLPLITAQYGPRPDEEFTTSTLFVKTLNTNGAAVVAYYHHDELGTPVSATDKSGNIVWAASYDVFGQATIVTPGATVERPTISSNLRLPGQYADAETGLHYNYRRYYDPTIGRYVSQDPIGFEGGDNLYRYAEADPVNQSDPTGECPMCVAYAGCVASCMLEDAATNAIMGECNNFGDSAKNCALTCAAGLGLGRLWKWGKKLWDRIPCSINSFPVDTVVHVRPAGLDASQALSGQTELKSISRIAVGDEVLAYSEWKEPGEIEGQDARLSYQRVTDVFTSFREQQLIHLTLEDGAQLTATEGHPFLTPEGWRDAMLLKRGGKLLLKADPEAPKQRWALIRDVRIETSVLPVFNLQVANAHTFFTGTDGVLTHNHGNSKSCKKFQWLYEIFNKRTGKTQKYGVTGTPPNSNGLPRPRSQLGPNEDYRIKDTAKNRNDILDKEREAVQGYRDNNNGKRPPKQERP